MLFYGILFIFLCKNGASVHVPQIVHLSVGEPFTFDLSLAVNPVVNDASSESLPTWLEWNQDLRQLRGVPEVLDAGEISIRISDSAGTNAIMKIYITEESENPCGDYETSWMEIVFKDFLKNLSVGQRIDLIDTICDYFEIEKQDLRLYSEGYKNEVRRYEISETNIDEEIVVDPRSTIVTMKAYCERIDDAVYVIDKLVGMDKDDLQSVQEVVGWRLTKGIVLPRKQEHQDHTSGYTAFASHETKEHRISTVKPHTTTSLTRSTRRIVDHVPVRLNSLPTFSCKRGVVCELSIPEKTFIDAEDGDTRSLSLSVFSISGKYNWLTVDKNRQVLRGICLETGDFEFRLEARDSSNQMTSAAFRVSVQEAPPSNHYFIIDIQHSYKGMMEPGVLYSFAEKLANSLGDRLPTNIAIRDAKAGNRNRSLITWYNSSLPFQICHKKAIDDVKHRMLTRKRDRVRNDFIRAMDSRFLVRDVKMELVGTCKSSASSADFESTTPTMVPAASPEVSSDTSYILLLIAFLGLLIILILIALLICFILRKRSKKTVQSEYVSKGLPVVFPEEIPQEDERATVATPMLVKEERPPLLVSHHDNPIYKPPPPISSASSPRPRNSTANQRLPPPYIPP